MSDSIRAGDSVLALALDTVEARAFAVPHEHDDGEICRTCLLAWLARARGPFSRP